MNTESCRALGHGTGIRRTPARAPGTGFLGEIKDAGNMRAALLVIGVPALQPAMAVAAPGPR
ncbi:hypothetical protein J7E88_31280 [Streptomyces sp. ISL-10]|uniref:hypothetical protein n=1 Tax=Streptomyces sp. ISL-10 TaxID=2819172 RepID=UPI001BE544B9|nr:hypothetical protein [Streptomyces sp. ISL-10]MBT2369633.1 hypothetical protein [Streptomyces sp. ISL-10]